MVKEQRLYRGRIIRDPKILAGKPTLQGTRIPVELVLAKLAYNADLNELFADYPRLTVEDVKACLEYAKEAVGREERERKVAVPHVRHASL